MQEILDQVLTELRGAWRYRWYAMLAAWTVALVGWAVVLTMSNIYRAQARVYVDSESLLKPLLSGLAVDSNVMSQVSLMSSALLSRPNLEKVARETGLDQRATDPARHEALINSLSANISLQGSHDNVFTIGYTDSDRFITQRVVQTLLNTFVEDTLGLKRSDSTSAQQFLEQQIAEYETRLRDAEARLADFKKKNVGSMPGATGDYYTRLQTSLVALEALRAKFRAASGRRDELQKQLEGEEPTFGLVGENQRFAAATPIDVKIAEYKARLDALLLQFTDKHPEVIALRESIAQLEEQRNSQQPVDSSPVIVDPQKAALRTLDINPVYQSIKIALSQTDVEIAELKRQIADQQQTVSELRNRVDIIPEVEAQLAQLNRDYEVNHSQYTALLQRLESARLSQNADESKERTKFRVVEPPVTPVKPIGPKRALFLTAVLFFAMGVGAVVAVAISQFNRVVSSRALLRALSGLPVLGSISRIELPEVVPLLRRQSTLFAASLGVLIVLYGIVLALADSVHASSASVAG